MSGGGGHHLPDMLQQSGAGGQEQTPGALTDGYQRAGAGEHAARALPIPVGTAKGRRPCQSWAGGKQPAHPS